MTTENNEERAEELAFKIHKHLMRTIRGLRGQILVQKAEHATTKSQVEQGALRVLELKRRESDLERRNDELAGWARQADVYAKARDALAAHVSRLEAPAANWDAFIRTIADRPGKSEGEPVTPNPESTGGKAAVLYLNALRAQMFLDELGLYLGLDGTFGETTLSERIKYFLTAREKERDEALQRAAQWEIQAQDFRDKLVDAQEQNAKLAEVSAEVLAYKARVEDLERALKGICKERDEAQKRADKWNVIDEQHVRGEVTFKDGDHVIRAVNQLADMVGGASRREAIDAVLPATRDPG